MRLAFLITTFAGPNPQAGSSRRDRRLRHWIAGASAVIVLFGLVGCSTRVELNESVQAELVEMRREDQAERAGNPELPPGTKLGPPQDFARAERLKEIIAEHGWPTFDLVGEDGASAAWLIAQHADFDVEFQEDALLMLETAVADGQGNPIDLAYLSDRVAVNSDEPQTFGTQVRCRDGVPAPATPVCIRRLTPGPETDHPVFLRLEISREERVAFDPPVKSSRPGIPRVTDSG